MTTIQVGDIIKDGNGEAWRIVCIDCPGDQPIVGVRLNSADRFCADGSYFPYHHENQILNLDLSTTKRANPPQPPSVALNELRRLSDDSELPLALIPDNKGLGADDCWSIYDLSHSTSTMRRLSTEIDLSAAVASASRALLPPETPLQIAARSLRGIEMIERNRWECVDGRLVDSGQVNAWRAECAAAYLETVKTCPT